MDRAFTEGENKLLAGSFCLDKLMVDIAEARADVAAGRVYSQAEILAELNFSEGNPWAEL